MHKDVSYHEAAIQYNEGLAAYAGELADSLEHPEVQKWCRSVSRQHEFHAGRHKKALRKLEAKLAAAEEEKSKPAEPEEKVIFSPSDKDQEITPAEAGVGTDVEAKQEVSA